MMQGKDGFGPFVIQADSCAECGEVGATVHYNKIRLPLEIEAKNTLLKDEGHGLGITCGDYAKFHRQVAHIVDSIHNKNMLRPPDVHIALVEFERLIKEGPYRLPKKYMRLLTEAIKKSDPVKEARP